MPLTIDEIRALKEASDAAEARVKERVGSDIQELREKMGAPSCLPAEIVPEAFSIMKLYQHFLILELGERGVIRPEDALAVVEERAVEWACDGCGLWRGVEQPITQCPECGANFVHKTDMTAVAKADRPINIAANDIAGGEA